MWGRTQHEPYTPHKFALCSNGIFAVVKEGGVGGVAPIIHSVLMTEIVFKGGRAQTRIH